MKERLIGVQCDFGAVFLLYIYIYINRILFVCCIVVVIEMMMMIIIIIILILILIVHCCCHCYLFCSQESPFSLMFFSLTNTESKFHVQLGSQTRSDLHLDLIDLLSVTSPSNSHRIQQIARVASIANSIAQTLLLRLLVKERINQIDRLHQLIAFIAHNLVHIVIRELLRYSSSLFFAAYASCSRADRTKCPCSTQDIC